MRFYHVLAQTYISNRYSGLQRLFGTFDCAPQDLIVDGLGPKIGSIAISLRVFGEHLQSKRYAPSLYGAVLTPVTSGLRRRREQSGQR